MSGKRLICACGKLDIDFEEIKYHEDSCDICNEYRNHFEKMFHPCRKKK